VGYARVRHAKTLAAMGAKPKSQYQDQAAVEVSSSNTTACSSSVQDKDKDHET